MLDKLKEESGPADGKQQKLLNDKVTSASLDNFEKAQRDALRVYDRDNQQFQIQTYLGGQIANRLMPLTNKVQ